MYLIQQPLPDASATQRGALKVGDQTFPSGNKEWAGDLSLWNVGGSGGNLYLGDPGTPFVTLTSTGTGTFGSNVTVQGGIVFGTSVNAMCRLDDSIGSYLKYGGTNQIGVNSTRGFSNVNWAPEVTNTRSIGESGLRWANVFSVLGNFSGSVTVAEGQSLRVSLNGDQVYAAGSGLFLEAASGSNPIYLRASDVRSWANNTESLGVTSNRWSNVFSVLGNYSGLLTASAGAAITGNVTMTSPGTGATQVDIQAISAGQVGLRVGSVGATAGNLLALVQGGLGDVFTVSVAGDATTVTKFVSTIASNEAFRMASGSYMTLDGGGGDTFIMRPGANQFFVGFGLGSGQGINIASSGIYSFQNNTRDLGLTGNRWRDLFIGRDSYYTTGSLKSDVANGASAVGFTADTVNAFSTDGAHLFDYKNAGTLEAYVARQGRIGVGKVATASLPAAGAGNEGEVVYDSTTDSVKVSDASGWREVGPHSYMEATISAVQSSNVGAGDHIKFDTVCASAGSLITLDTATSYVNTQNTASVGRFTLKGGHTYRIIFRPTFAAFSTGATAKVNMGIWNSDDATVIGQTSTFQPKTDTGNSAQDGTLTVYYTPATDKRIEVRFVAVTAFTSIGVVDTYNFFPTVLIESIR